MAAIRLRAVAARIAEVAQRPAVEAAQVRATTKVRATQEVAAIRQPAAEVQIAEVREAEITQTPTAKVQATKA